MKVKIISILLVALCFSGCAQVPTETTELSVTVGRDIAIAQQAHVQLATMFFARMKQDVNRFVDGTYATYQIKNAMQRQKQLADSDTQSQRNKSLLLAINAAFKADASDKLQSSVLKAMGLLIKSIHDDIESKRSELLEPLNQQEEQVLASINKVYQQIHYANAIVTAQLASIVKVHDVQSEFLADLGVKNDLRKEIGDSIASASSKIASLVDKAEGAEGQLDSAESTANSLKQTIVELKSKLTNKEE